MSRSERTALGSTAGRKAASAPLPLSAKSCQWLRECGSSLATKTFTLALPDTFAQQSTVIGVTEYTGLGAAAAYVSPDCTAPPNRPSASGSPRAEGERQ